jgi:hypothetical protein
MPLAYHWPPGLRTFVRWFLIGVAILWLLAVLTLVAARWIDPPTTAVHIERRWQARIQRKLGFVTLSLTGGNSFAAAAPESAVRNVSQPSQDRL